MPHVYKELHSSFVSLVWFWSGRSLPPGEPVGVAIWGCQGVSEGVRGVLGAFLELQKSPLVSFQGCWTQWQRLESSSIHHFWDTPTAFSQNTFLLRKWLSFIPRSPEIPTSKFPGVLNTMVTVLKVSVPHFWLFWRDKWENVHSVLWSSANLCNISQNMYSYAPVASQH